ncbi:OB-fold domain-containing protein, partial [Myxococcota bacterium]|nr:OB-fold domain-containing protein [Myxococcota bacterium]
DFAESVPYAAVIVEMDEGVRLLSQVIDVEPSQLEIDLPVEVVFDPGTDEVTLPRFRRASL